MSLASTPVSLPAPCPPPLPGSTLGPDSGDFEDREPASGHRPGPARDPAPGRNHDRDAGDATAVPAPGAGDPVHADAGPPAEIAAVADVVAWPQATATAGPAGAQPTAAAPAPSTDLSSTASTASAPSAQSTPPLRIVYESTWRDQFQFSAVHQFLSVKLQAVTLLSVFAIVLFYASERGLVTQVTLFAEIFVAFWIFQLLVTAVYLHSSRNKSLLTRRVLALRDDALSVESRYSLSYFYWSGIDRAVSHPGYIAIYLNAHLAEVIPDRAFASPAQRASFLATAVARIDEARTLASSGRDPAADRSSFAPAGTGAALLHGIDPAMTTLQPNQKRDLAALAARAMAERGLLAEFPAAALGQAKELDQIAEARVENAESADVVDLTGLPWCSIDNDDSRDLDQLTVSQPLGDGTVRILVAIADVDSLVDKGSPIDDYARHNTTSVYTSARIFPMLPERLSTDLTSLNPGTDRLAIVCDMVVAADAAVLRSTITRARVRNHVQLAYDAVAGWLEGRSAVPEAVEAVDGLEAQLVTQDEVAQRLRARRRAAGALAFQTFQPRASFDGERVVAIEQQVQNRARQLIEEFMIATNGEIARYLGGKRRPSIRRVVRSPERWEKIRGVAAEYGESLPVEADPVALQQFLAARRASDPLRFPDLSLTVIKLMGAGEYVVERPGDTKLGHFGLAVRDYTHSTAPNRRFPDLVTQRLLKAALRDEKAPYGEAELHQLAAHCTEQEDAADKVERQLRKSEAALLLAARIGEVFEAVVTGAARGNTWVRIVNPPAEGKLLQARERRVGERLKVRLEGTDFERGYIDFAPFDEPTGTGSAETRRDGAPPGA